MVIQFEEQLCLLLIDLSDLLHPDTPVRKYFQMSLSQFAGGCKEPRKIRNSARAGKATTGGPKEKLAQMTASAIQAGMPIAFPAVISQTSQSPS